MRRLTVLNVAYPMAPVGPDAVGGAEQVLSALDHALVEAGHRSLVVACDGSVVRGELFPTPAPTEPEIDAATLARHRRATADQIAAVLERNAVDVIHMHGIDYHEYLPPPGVPLLATLHLPPGWYPPEGLCPPRPRSFVHGVSRAQSAAITPWGRHVLPSIPNGVPVERLGALRPKRCSYALVLARICPEKGIHLALDAARAAGVKLLIAGAVFPYPEHQAYFEREIRPRLDRDRRYLGPVGFRRKRRLLAAARCLLVPSLAPETSSLVAMEAASCGTPVVAFRVGALPEVVEDGRSGFLVDDVAGMTAAIGRVGTLEAEACRAVAKRRFTLGRMAGRYLTRYRDLAHHGIDVRGASCAAATSDADLAALAPDWEALWRATPDATPFQSPHWLLPWWQVFGTGKPVVSTWREDDRLVGIVPCYLLDEGGRSKMLPIGAGTTDYLDALGGMSGTLMVWALHRAAMEGVTCCDMIEVPPGSALREVDGSDGWDGWTVTWSAGSACPVLILPGIPHKMRRNLTLARNRAARLGPVELEEATAATLDAALDTLIALHGARWTGQGERGVLADPAVLRFHRLAAPGLLGAGLLRLCVLRVGGTPVAACLALLDRTRIHFYLSGYDPAWHHVSPGTLLFGAMLDQAVGEGRTEAHFLRGQEGYKYAWGAVDRINATGTFRVRR